MLGAPEIAIALSGLPPRAGSSWGSTTPEACEFVRGLRVRGVALDLSRPDCRARDLGRSARRDLAAMVRRCELELAGVDLWIPPEHFADPNRAERAFEGVQSAAVMAAELARLVGGRSRPVVSVALPASLGAGERAALSGGADRYGAVVADHAPDAAVHAPGLRIGVDPASCLLAGATPEGRVHQARDDLAALRLSDVNAMGRCPVGAEGARLDLLAYAASTFGTDPRWITADTRGIAEPARAVRAALDAWRSATALPSG